MTILYSLIAINKPRFLNRISLAYLFLKYLVIHFCVTVQLCICSRKDPPGLHYTYAKLFSDIDFTCANILAWKSSTVPSRKIFDKLIMYMRNNIGPYRVSAITTRIISKFNLLISVSKIGLKLT